MAYGATPTKFASRSSSLQLVPAGSVIALVGFSIRESSKNDGSSAASALCRLWDGTGAAGPTMIPIALLPNESARDWFGSAIQTTGGIAWTSGIYLEVLAGSVEGVVFYEVAE